MWDISYPFRQVKSSEEYFVQVRFWIAFIVTWIFVALALGWWGLLLGWILALATGYVITPIFPYVAMVGMSFALIVNVVIAISMAAGLILTIYMFVRLLFG